MPSSVKVGMRSMISTARLYSVLQRPTQRRGTGQPRDLRYGRSCQCLDQAGEEWHAVERALQRMRRVFGMRHQPQHGLGLVEDAGDGTRRAVGVVPLLDLA